MTVRILDPTSKYLASSKYKDHMQYPPVTFKYRLFMFYVSSKPEVSNFSSCAHFSPNIRTVSSIPITFVYPTGLKGYLKILAILINLN